MCVMANQTNDAMKCAHKFIHVYITTRRQLNQPVCYLRCLYEYFGKDETNKHTQTSPTVCIVHLVAVKKPVIRVGGGGRRERKEWEIE